MISNNILDEIFPVPELNDLKEEKIRELNESGFKITNFNSGGIFNSLLMIVLQIYIEFIKLFRTVIPQMYVKHATGIWLVLKAQDYSKERKAATKVTGILTLSGSASHETITVPKGTTFKTDRDINGEELRFFSTEDVTFLTGTESVSVPIEAEMEGAKYNVSSGQIVKCIKHLEGVEKITNGEEWISIPGADIEEIESLRSRTLNSWSDLATGTIAAKYKSAAEKVDGVLYADVDQLHPRGQGTVDIIITSTAGSASEELLKRVEQAVEDVQGEYDNLLIKSADAIYQDISITATLPALASSDGVESRVVYAVNNYFKISSARNLNELILLDIYCTIKDEVPVLKNIKITDPADDVFLGKGNVIMLGNLNITVNQET